MKPPPLTDEEVTGREELPKIESKFKIGDKVKIPSKSHLTGIISDVWSSLGKQSIMYAVETQDGRCALYAENQLEEIPLPIDYKFESCIDGNVAVATMIATQGDKTWIYARGHAHIIHDGEVGLAQSISYATKRMFESVAIKNGERIHRKPKNIRGDSK